MKSALFVKANVAVNTKLTTFSAGHTAFNEYARSQVEI
jgi:hypothetical protein